MSIWKNFSCHLIALVDSCLFLILQKVPVLPNWNDDSENENEILNQLPSYKCPMDWCSFQNCDWIYFYLDDSNQALTEKVILYPEGYVYDIVHLVWASFFLKIVIPFIYDLRKKRCFKSFSLALICRDVFNSSCLIIMWNNWYQFI